MAASLNGGNCLAAFVKMLQEWAVDLGLTINQGKIWEKTIALGTVYIRTVKFRYSKKVTKIDEISILDLIFRYYKSKLVISQNFVAVSLNLNFMTSATL